MPNISSLTMPDGIVYAIKDSQARKDIEDIKKNSAGGNGGSGGGGAVYATFTEDNGTWSCDKTYAELKAAYDAGSAMFAVVDGEGITPLMFNDDDDDMFVGVFTTVYISSNQIAGLYYFQFAIQSDGAVVGMKSQKEIQGK